MSTRSETALIALFDVGKTNTKLSLIDPHTHAELWSARRANGSVTTERGRELDVVAIERWLIEALRDAPHKDRIAVIVPVAHGAAAVLVDRNGQVLAAPDYEDTCYQSVSREYDKARDAFATTFSPNLPCGLNLARQLYYLQQTHAPLFERTAHILLYPQYWAWRCSGALASEVTSLGCHTDLWRPGEARFSDLAQRSGWVDLFPELRLARDKIGTLTPEIAAKTGSDRRCEIVAGIHDSNASYLKFLIGRKREPFIVVSSGTWTIVMANGGQLSCLKEERDMLANVNALGAPVPTARFMGGREYEAIAQGSDAPTREGLQEVVRSGAMALPSFASAGPFSGRKGALVNAESLSGAARASLATLYSALMTELSIEALGVRGEIFVDGPLATNPLFGPLLASMTSADAVRILAAGVGSARVAAYLAGFEPGAKETLTLVEPLQMPGLDAYVARWREQVAKR